MAKLTEIVNTPQTSNLLKSKQNPWTQSRKNSKLPDEQAENNEFTAHLNTDSKHIHMWEMSELDAETKTGHTVNTKKELTTESALKFELEHVRKLLGEAINESKRLTEENIMLKKDLEERFVEDDTTSTSSLAEYEYDNHIFELNEEIAVLKDNVNNYLTSIHQLETDLEEQLFIRKENEAEIQRLRKEIAQQMQINQELTKQIYEQYPHTHCSTKNNKFPTKVKKRKTNFSFGAPLYTTKRKRIQFDNNLEFF